MVGLEERSLGELNYDIRPINNKVILRVDYDPEEEKTEAGIYKGSGWWDSTGHLVRYGEVVSVCDKLFEREEDGFGVEWGTEVEVQVGDTVYMSKMESYNAPLFKKDGKIYFVVDYSELVLRIRDGVVYPLNGYLIVEKVEETAKANGLILDFSKHQNKKKGIVREVGSKLRYYFPKSSNIVDAEVEKHDLVLFSLSGFTTLEDSRYAKLDKNLGYIQRRWVIAKLV